ncbi:MAG: polymer-forming cytoskeletal protein [Chloroflexi bacterium]|nr:polymer-forming cytoskeletal protein [Chloroflexota bacterium]
MASGSVKASNPKRFSFLRRKQAWREISGYQVGNIHETQPVAIAATATVVGNVFAPQLIVAGLLSGTAVSPEVTVQAEGQIWGDIYATRLHVEQGGLIRGWVHTLDDAAYQLLNGRHSPIDPLPDDAKAAPNGLKPEHHRLRDNADLDARRWLQMETAVALAARTELEETFDQRLAEIAGEATNQLTITREELKTTRAELTTWQQQAQDKSSQLQQRDTQLERQGRELALAQETLAHTNQELEELREAYAAKEALLKELTLAKVGVDTHLHEALQHVDTLTGRVHNIETALQASLVHSSDQEDALQRWQELAETTEKRAAELEVELATVRQQLEQSKDLNNLLRDQRKQIEDEWVHAQIRLEELQKQLENETEASRTLLADSDETIRSLTSLNAQLKEELEPLQNRNAILMKQMEMAKTKFFKQEEDMAQLRRQYAELESAWTAAQDELERIRQQPTKLFSSEQLDDLKAQLTAVAEKADSYQEQMLWHQANLETSQAALKKSQQLAEQQAAQLAQQQQELERLWQQMQDQRGQEQGELRLTKENLRQKQMQLEASEADLQHHLQETAHQGQRLAEMQSLLIERELQWQQAQQTIAKQQQLIKQMKQVTVEKISSLEAALAQARRE